MAPRLHSLFKTILRSRGKQFELALCFYQFARVWLLSVFCKSLNRIVSEIVYFGVGKTKVSPHTCGTLGNSKNATRIRRIVGGISSDYGAWPWQVAISYNSTSMYSTLELLASKSIKLRSLPPGALSFWLR